MFKRAFIFIFLIAIMAACNFGPSPEEEIFNHLEEAVALESGFEEQQTPLVTLEKKEQEIYDEILDLGMSEFDKIKSLSEEALNTVNKREEHIEAEKTSIETAKTEFEKIKPLIEEIEDDNVKNKANELNSLMDKRYEVYKDLYKSYKSALSLDRELYEMFKQEDLTLEALETKIEEINKSYEDVVEHNKQFNDYTNQYNELKKEFYETAGLNVVYE